MSENKYTPYKYSTTYQYVIKLARRAVRKLQKALESDTSPDVGAIINEEYYDLQSFIGETCGDKATRYLGFEDEKWILEASRDGGDASHEPHALLDDALTMKQRDLDSDIHIYKWINHMMDYADSCYGDPRFMPTWFDASQNGHKVVRKLLEGNLGLVAELVPTWYRDNDTQYIYRVEDSRGEEYGEWWIAPMDHQDGQHEEQIAVSKWFGDTGSGGKFFNVQVSFGDFCTFFHEVIK
jgi:hypothetical protein